MEDQKLTRRRRFRYVISRLAVITIVIFLIANFLVPDRAFSDTENRSLQQRPPLSGMFQGGWGASVDKWYSDQFVLRDGFVELNSLALRMIGQREINGIYIGKDGYLFESPTAMDTEKTKRTAEAVSSFVSDHSDLKASMILVPDAASVLRDKWPDNAPLHSQSDEIDSFLEGLPESVSTLNATEALRQAAGSEDGTQVFYRTDHHWTTEGAKAVFDAADDTLGIEQTTEYERYTVSNTFQGTLASQSADYASKDAIDIFVPTNAPLMTVNYGEDDGRRASVYMPEMLQEKDQYQVFFGGNHATVEINTTADTGRSLLVFKDSFANSFVPFLTPYFDTIIMVDMRYYYDDIDTLLSSYDMTDVLFLYSANTLWNDTELAAGLQ